MKRVEVLALILMKSFDLNIKYRIRVKLDSADLFNMGGKALFVIELYFGKLIKHLLIVGKRRKLIKSGRVINKLAADKLCQVFAQLWV